jgi:hypothetical protein
MEYYKKYPTVDGYTVGGQINSSIVLRGIFVLFRGIEWNLDNVVEVFSYYL